MKYPDLLVRQNLEAPFRSALTQLNRICDEALHLQDDTVALAGMAVLAVSAIEAAFRDSMTYYYAARPSSIPLAQATYSREELQNARAPIDLLLLEAARHVSRSGRGGFANLVRKFSNAVELPLLAQAIESNVAEFAEFKASRNALVHSEVPATTNLLERPSTAGLGIPRSTIRRKYLLAQVESGSAILDEVLAHVSEQYGPYSRLAAIERLWYWLFESPIMKFEQFWEVDAEGDKVVAPTGIEERLRLSNSERILLSVWLAHFNQTPHAKAVTMYSLDSENQRKLLHLLAITGRFRMY